MVDKKWYEKYKKLNSQFFQRENSGNSHALSPPFRYLQDSDWNILDIKGIYGMETVYEIVGYTENPIYYANYPCVAIMFERKDDFERIWWHYPKD